LDTNTCELVTGQFRRYLW